MVAMNPASGRPERGKHAVDGGWSQLSSGSFRPLFLELLLESLTDTSCPELFAVGSHDSGEVIKKPFEVLGLGDASLLGTRFAVYLF